MKALLVDLYDTLVWTDWSALAERLAARLEVDGAALLQAFEATRVGRGTGQFGSIRGDLAALVRAAGGPAAGGRAADVGFLAALETELLTHLREAVHLYDEVRDVLRARRAAGTRVAIVSNCDHITRPVLENLALEAEVDASVLSCEVGSLKPDALIFEQALARLGATASEALFVDDQPAYLDGARAVGIRTAQIVRAPSADEPTEGDALAHPIIWDLTDLTRFWL